MAERFTSLSPDLARWWCEQPVFFVATAPGGDAGHVNLSPKGLHTLRVLAGDRVAYLDLTGSGVETIAHVRSWPSSGWTCCCSGADPSCRTSRATSPYPSSA